MIEEYAGGNKSAFARLLGVAPSNITTWLARGTIDWDLLHEHLPDLNMNWLASGGEGEMRISALNNTIKVRTGAHVGDNNSGVVGDNNTTAIPDSNIEALVQSLQKKDDQITRLLEQQQSLIDALINRNNQ